MPQVYNGSRFGVGERAIYNVCGGGQIPVIVVKHCPSRIRVRLPDGTHRHVTDFALSRPPEGCQESGM